MTHELTSPLSKISQVNNSQIIWATQPDAEPNSLPRSEYPRPAFRRHTSSWRNLNGVWEFAFDDSQQGLQAGWQADKALPGNKTITVPFAFQSHLSGIGDPAYHDHIWYARQFELPPEWKNTNQRFLLHFGAVDYYCQVWVNGYLAGEHRGGHVPFSFDITTLLNNMTNRVVLFVEDTQSRTQPRGKQFWKPESEFCFYTRTSGIWQTVWLEAVAPAYLDNLRIETDIDRAELGFAVQVAGDIQQACQLQVEISYAGELVYSGGFSDTAGTFAERIALPELHLWSPETPHLYDFRLKLYREAELLDEADSYFGMRKVSIEHGRFNLNNRPYYLRLVLDQGYFPGGNLTAPSDDALRHDIELTKQFGFNGVRKHQKIEDPRWLYWADKLGLVVWGEMPSAHLWAADAEEAFIAEWAAFVKRDYNHPCVITWVPFNESWGLAGIATEEAQRQFVRRVVALTRQLDNTRPVIDNDGWEHQAGHSDLLTVHDYTANGTDFLQRYAAFEQTLDGKDLPLVSDRPIILPGGEYRNEPIIFTEVGGISLIPSHLLAEKSAEGTWGYSNASNVTVFEQQYAHLLEAFNLLKHNSGFCYTQLTDVEQEVNGLLTFDRRPKVNPEFIAQCNRLVHAGE